ncbi:MAG TPA: allantoicase [Gemmatimonadales bacterium]|nr:allantoicase [Gemmatimonadales bacterium]
MPAMFTDLPDLAAERLGGAVIAASDEFFAPKEGLIKPTQPEWREGVYTDRGKWMDGWEPRRRRTPGHDWAILRLGLPGIVRGVVIDTSFFTGNYPERASLDGCCLGDDPSPLSAPSIPWFTLLLPSSLEGNKANLFALEGEPRRVTHVRLNIFPDGGVARLRVHGEVVPDEHFFGPGLVDLAALAHGGLAVACSDRHYGNPQHLLFPGPSTHMGDGWETRRRRGPGHDWVVIRLGRRGTIERVELDTDHYKGNAPGSCMLESCDSGPGFDPDSARWEPLVPEVPLQPDSGHQWTAANGARMATHVRLGIYPDGGVARLRIFGRAEPVPRAAR